MLQLRYLPEDEWHGELQVEARQSGYSGKAGAYFNRDDIRNFAVDLRALAVNGVMQAELKGGYFSDSTTSSMPVETHVGIHVARKPTKFIASVHLADSGDAIQQQSVHLQMEMTWASLYYAADAIDAMLIKGGTAAFKVVQDRAADPALYRARHRIARPYPQFLLALQKRFGALIETMPANQPASTAQMTAEEWEAYNPSSIIVEVDWLHACLICRWGVGDDEPTVASTSPEYVFDLAELKAEAQKSPHPRAFFESYAAHVLSYGQSCLSYFYRDGPTDDVPLDRHLIFVRGLTGAPAQVWVSNLQFTYDEAQA